MPDFELISLTQLRDEGKVVTNLVADDLIYIVHNGESYVIKWANVLSVIAANDPPAPGASSPFVIPNANGVAAISLPAETHIYKLSLYPTGTGIIKIGTTNGGEEILEEYDFEAGVTDSIDIDFIYPNSNAIYVVADAAIKVRVHYL